MPPKSSNDPWVQYEVNSSGPAPTQDAVSATPPLWDRLRDKAINQLPTVGGIVGGLIGAESVPTAVAGAAAGGALGEDAKQALQEHFHPKAKPMDVKQALGGMAKQGAGQAASELVGQGVGKAVGPTLQRTINKLYYAANLGPKEDLEAVMPEILAHEKQAPVKTVGDLVDAVSTAKKKIGTEVDAAMSTPVMVGGKRVPLGSLPANGKPIADDIRNLVGNHPSEIEMNPAKIDAIKKRAQFYEQGGASYAWLNDRRTVLNKELNKFYALKTPADKALYLSQHPNFEIDKAEADAIRDVVYPEMDRAAGKPAGYFEKLQRKRGALMSVEDQTQEHLQDLKTRTKRSKGAPALERARVGVSAGASGKPHGWVGNILGAVHAPNPLRAADKRAASAFGHTVPSKVAGFLGSDPGVEVMSLPLRELIPEEQPETQQ